MILSLATQINCPTLYLTHHGLTDNNVYALTLRTESWSFILSIVICHDFLYKKINPILQTSGGSLKVVETEIEATEEVLKKYRNKSYNSAVTCTRETPLQIDSWFAESKPRKKGK